MTLGSSQAYGEASYWDIRYSQESGPFDWYQRYCSLAPLLNLYLPRGSRILVVGCGNSALGEGMVDDGYEDVVNIDISYVVIEAMRKKYCNRPQLKYIKMDVRDMSTFQTGSFDAVIDKGTLDSLLCGNNSQQDAAMMLEEVGRVLKEQGIYMLITYGAPASRLPLLRNSFMWKIELHVIVLRNRKLFGASLAIIHLVAMFNRDELDREVLIDKAVSSGGSGQMKWELTDAVPLDEDGSSVEAVLGKNPEVHYIYVCTKDDSLTQHGDGAVVQQK